MVYVATKQDSSGSMYVWQLWWMSDVCVCVSQGDFTWNSMSGRSVRLKPVPLQSLSELERDRLQDVAFSRLLQDYDLNCQITIPKGTWVRAHTHTGTHTRIHTHTHLEAIPSTHSKSYLFQTFLQGLSQHAWMLPNPKQAYISTPCRGFGVACLH